MSQNAHILHICSAFETFSALLAGLIQNFNTASESVFDHSSAEINAAFKYSRFNRAMLTMEISLGHSA